MVLQRDLGLELDQVQDQNTPAQEGLVQEE